MQADVYLLTDERPALLPDPRSKVAAGLKLAFNEAASDSLLTDLRSDKGMEWVPQSAWLTKVEIDGSAGELRFDLAIDASGAGRPSPRDAGFAPFGPLPAPPSPSPIWTLLIAGALLVPLGGAALVAGAARSGGGRPLAGA